MKNQEQEQEIRKGSMMRHWKKALIIAVIITIIIIAMIIGSNNGTDALNTTIQATP